MLENIVEPLLQWYKKDHRMLPWRESKNPYFIWISEIMLQQTRVEAVKPYFQRFRTALPTVNDVADCEEERLLKLWEGLGYYNRVRNIQKAAVVLKEQYNGALPEDYELLKSLPGIGNYTAGAIASIAFGIPVPAVDGNVLRVISRVELRREDIMKQSVRRKVEEDLLAIMPPDASGDFNQALMELGAMVCLPNGLPECDRCPLIDQCRAYAEDCVMELPVKAPKKGRRIEERTILVIQDGDRVAITKRPNKGLLAGMYELPNLEGHLTEQQAVDFVEGLELTSLRIQPLEEAKHIFSHIEWRMIGYVVRVASLEKTSHQGYYFVNQKETEGRYAIPAAFAAYTRYMNIRLGQTKYRQEERERQQ
ncbi:MAG: A/G-specific adenine glycosylase [Lachnospiraceae bacterium]|nr:A/G-specific adenine glycosylase [Lachnospiraceae bacterium]